MPEKAQRTIHIEWVRSTIGFPRSQRELIRGLGLRRLHHVVERPDTPQIRGLVGNVPHLVQVVEVTPPPAWKSVPEYTIKPPEAKPVPALAPTAASSTTETPGAAAKKKTERQRATARPVEVKTEGATKKAAAKKGKTGKASAAKKKSEEKAAKGKAAKPSKKGKK